LSPGTTNGGTMIRTLDPSTISPPASAYSHGVLIPPGAALAVTSGTLGLEADGELPEDFDGQCRLVWNNTAHILASGGFTLNDIVKVTTYLPDRAHVAAYRDIRDQFLPHRPASTVIIAELIDPRWLIETEVMAARPASEQERSAGRPYDVSAIR
jgi:enamine deaminase RidA (YjgF/YER057c/UK114 family)